MAQWAHLAKLRVPFHLYVPINSVDVARRLSHDYKISVTEIWSYHQVGEQFKFTLFHPASGSVAGGAPRHPGRCRWRAFAWPCRSSRSPWLKSRSLRTEPAPVAKPGGKGPGDQDDPGARGDAGCRLRPRPAGKAPVVQVPRVVPVKAVAKPGRDDQAPAAKPCAGRPGRPSPPRTAARQGHGTPRRSRRPSSRRPRLLAKPVVKPAAESRGQARRQATAKAPGRVAPPKSKSTPTGGQGRPRPSRPDRRPNPPPDRSPRRPPSRSPSASNACLPCDFRATGAATRARTCSTRPRRRTGPEQPQLLYWFRSPPHVKVGRAAFDEDAIRVLEEQHPDVEFDWDRILTTKPPAAPESRDPREARPARRPERRPAKETDATRPRPSAQPSAVPAAADAA